MNQNPQAEARATYASQAQIVSNESQIGWKISVLAQRENESQKNQYETIRRTNGARKLLGCTERRCSLPIRRWRQRMPHQRWRAIKFHSTPHSDHRDNRSFERKFQTAN
jgi:hypothetical protein